MISRSLSNLLCFLLLSLGFSVPVKAQQPTTVGQTKNEQITDRTSIVMPADDSIYTTTELAASVDKKLWRRHLGSKLGEPTINAMKEGIKPGKYSVDVQFIVEKDGSITAVKALNDPGYGLAKSAVKVVQTGPRWTAAEQEGKKVRSYHTQPITFFIGQTTLINN